MEATWRVLEKPHGRAFRRAARSSALGLCSQGEGREEWRGGHRNRIQSRQAGPFAGPPESWLPSHGETACGQAVILHCPLGDGLAGMRGQACRACPGAPAAQTPCSFTPRPPPPPPGSPGSSLALQWGEQPAPSHAYDSP